jgi:hypothetical protein
MSKMYERIRNVEQKICRKLKWMTLPQPIRNFGKFTKIRKKNFPKFRLETKPWPHQFLLSIPLLVDKKCVYVYIYCIYRRWTAEIVWFQLCKAFLITKSFWTPQAGTGMKCPRTLLPRTFHPSTIRPLTLFPGLFTSPYFHPWSVGTIFRVRLS